MQFKNRETILSGFAIIVTAVFLFFRPTADIAPPEPTAPVAPQTPNGDSQSAWLPGVDVSHYQHRVSWSAVKSAGIRFVYLKTTDGKTFTDPLFEHNVEALETLGIPFGGYHFFDHEVDPIEQADHFLGKATVRKGSLPPVLDVESTHRRTPSDIRERVEKWLRHVEKKTGCKPMIYTNVNFWNRYLRGQKSATKFLDYPLWLADYAEKPPKDVRWIFWQHSQAGQVDGIEVVVDLDWFAGDEKAFAKILC